MEVVVANQLDPNQLIDSVTKILKLRNDAALARVLRVGHPTLSKVRSGKSKVTASLLISMHEETGCSIRDLRFLMNDFRPHTGKSAGELDKRAVCWRDHSGLSDVQRPGWRANQHDAV